MNSFRKNLFGKTGSFNSQLLSESCIVTDDQDLEIESHRMNSINLVGYCLLMPENCACERSKRMSEVFLFPKLNSFLPEFGINRSLP